MSVCANAFPALDEAALALPTRRAEGGSDAWRRELEKAKASWFYGAMPPHAASEPRAGGMDASAVLQRPALAANVRTMAGGFHVPPLSADHAARFARMSNATAECPSAIGVRPATPLLQPPLGSTLSPLDGEEQAPQAESSPNDLRRPAGPPTVSMPTAPDGAGSIRVHLEQGANGVAVWLGLDGTLLDVTDQAESVLSELRRKLEASGQRLATVICNGLTMYEATDPAEHQRINSQGERP
jgi:hypothetical protein